MRGRPQIDLSLDLAKVCPAKQAEAASSASPPIERKAGFLSQFKKNALNLPSIPFTPVFNPALDLYAIYSGFTA
jgi:hypothetical protein